ncbi:MAG: hypothetical protein Q9186_005783 [Xanthomendoza sp. 1 TL-2023]
MVAETKIEQSPEIIYLIPHTSQTVCVRSTKAPNSSRKQLLTRMTTPFSSIPIPDSTTSSSSSLSSACSTRTFTSLLLTRQDLHTQRQILEQLLTEYHNATASSASPSASGQTPTQGYDYYKLPSPRPSPRPLEEPTPSTSTVSPAVIPPLSMNFTTYRSTSIASPAAEDEAKANRLLQRTMADLQDLTMGLALVEVEIEMMFIRERVRTRIENGGAGWGGEEDVGR